MIESVPFSRFMAQILINRGTLHSSYTRLKPIFTNRVAISLNVTPYTEDAT
jgi:hypothetical protein